MPRCAGPPRNSVVSAAAAALNAMRLAAPNSARLNMDDGMEFPLWLTREKLRGGISSYAHVSVRDAHECVRGARVISRMPPGAAQGFPAATSFSFRNIR